MSSSLLNDDDWLIRESGFDPTRANVYETLFTTGNGRIGTRGTLEEGHVGALSGVYLNGVFDANDSIVTDMVNAPDWVDTEVFVGGTRLDVDTCTVVSHERALDLSQGLLWRSTVFADDQGRQTRVESLRLASLATRALCALRIEVTPIDHDASVEIVTGIDGDRRNLEAQPVYPHGTTFGYDRRWEKWSLSQHLAPIGTAADHDVLTLLASTIQTGVTLAYAAATTVSPETPGATAARAHNRVSRRFSQSVDAGATVRLDKFVAMCTSRDIGAPATTEALLAQAEELAKAACAGGMDALLDENATRWAELWEACDAQVLGDPVLTQAVRFSIYHLLICGNPDDPTVNIGAKSLSGEGYRGHVFWDTEVMMLPFFVLTQPQTAKALLGYRSHTLDGARRNSAENGTLGARYAWESADTGDEECPRFTPDGANRFWTRDEELHVSADVAYGIYRYVEATGDTAFLREQGAEMLFETSRFWASQIETDPDGSGHLRKVMGPDEFHSHVDDNAFTNRLVQWHLRYAADVYDSLATGAPDVLAELVATLALDPGEVATWRRLADDIVVGAPNEDGVIEQFADYFGRLDVPVTDWDENNMPRYPEGYNHFNCEETQLLKQPDVLMLAFMLPELFDAPSLLANFDYYEPRTLHKSSLSPAIHAIIGIEVGDTTRAVQYFQRSALVDVTDNQGNTSEGMHIASAAGTWAVLVNGFGGLRIEDGKPHIAPWIPDEWDGVAYRITWAGLHLQVEATRERVTIATSGPEGATLPIVVSGQDVSLEAGVTTTVETITTEDLDTGADA